MLFECVCVFNLLQDIHQFALRQIDVYLSQARAQKNTHHYLLITPYILIQTSGACFMLARVPSEYHFGEWAFAVVLSGLSSSN